MSEEQVAQGTDFVPAGNSGDSDGGGEGSGQGQARFRRRRRRTRPAGSAAAEGGAVAISASSGGEESSAPAPVASAPAPAEAPAASSAQAQPQAAPQQNQNAPRPQQNQNGQGGQGGQNQFGGRRKNRRKKFIQDRQGSSGGSGQPQQAPPGNRADRPQSNAGYQNNNGGGFSNNNGGGSNFQNRRKQKSRNNGGGGARAFVGPMDHMYREGNGNYAEAPPSTMSVNGNQNGGHRRSNNSQQHDSGHQSQFLGRYYEPPAPVIADDAPTHVFCLIDDLFFTAKITEAARKLGVKVAFLKAEKEDLAKITDAAADSQTSLLMVDLNNANAKPLTVINKLHTKLKRGVSIVGFLSNLQGDLKAKAVEAGCDSVMPRSAFSQSLPNLLRRYGLTVEQNDAADAQHAYF